jgi:hypothetical protein
MSCVLQAYRRLALELLLFELLAWHQHWKAQRKDLVTLFGSCSSEPVLVVDQVAAVVQVAVVVQVVAVELAAAVAEALAVAVEVDMSWVMKAATAELHGTTATAAAAIAVYRAKVGGSWHEVAQAKLLEEVPALLGCVTKIECLHRH